jgi:uncharacterized OsmC-like protein
MLASYSNIVDENTDDWPERLSLDPAMYVCVDTTCMKGMDIRELQRPLKQQYRATPSSSKITLKADGKQSDSAMACSVDIGRAIYAAEAHTGVGGPGTAACSGDLLLGALAACAQITAQLVATALGIPFRSIATEVAGDLDLAGTLGISKEVPVGFGEIRVRFTIDAPEASEEQIALLRSKTEQYCVVMQTLLHPPAIETSWSAAD